MEFQEGLPGLEPAGGSATEGGGGAMSVCHVLSGGGQGSLIFWGGDLGFVGGDVTEGGGGTRGIPKADNGVEVSAIEERDLVVCISKEVP